MTLQPLPNFSFYSVNFFILPQQGWSLLDEGALQGKEWGQSKNLGKIWDRNQECLLFIILKNMCPGS